MTERLARSCSRHPWRTIGGWIVAVVLAVAALALLLGDLTTEGHPTNNPESQRADALIGRGFPPDPSRASERPRRRQLAALHGRRPAVPRVRRQARRRGPCDRRRRERARLLRDARQDAGLERPARDVDPDRSSRTPTTRAPWRTSPQRADKDAAFAVAVTGDQTIDNDFNELSQHDLKSGELQFGIPAALDHPDPRLRRDRRGPRSAADGDHLDRRRARAVARLSQPFNLSVFIFNMLTGMGLALGIDYSLFVVSRYQRGTCGRARPARRDRRRRRDREPRSARQWDGFRRRDVRDVDRAEQRDAQPRARRDPRRCRLGRRGFDAPAGAARPARRSDQLGSASRSSAAHRSSAATRKGGSGARSSSACSAVPAFSLIVATALLLALAVPVLGLKVGSNGVSTLPDRFESKRGFVALQRDFPRATTDPVLVVVDHASDPRVTSALGRLRSELATDHRFAGRGDVLRSTDGQIKVLQVAVRGDSAGAGRNRGGA